MYAENVLVRLLLKRAVTRRVWELLAAIIYTCFYCVLLLLHADTASVYASSSSIMQCVPTTPTPRSGPQPEGTEPRP